MTDFVSKTAAWFEGKKTIIGGFLVIAGSAAAAWYGKLDFPTSLALAGIGFSAIGLGDKANRHQAQLLTALQGIAQAGLDYRTGNTAGALKAAEGATATIVAPALVQEVQDLGTGVHATFHVSANSNAELLTAMDQLGGVLQRKPASAPAASSETTLSASQASTSTEAAIA